MSIDKLPDSASPDLQGPPQMPVENSLSHDFNGTIPVMPETQEDNAEGEFLTVEEERIAGLLIASPEVAYSLDYHAGHGHGKKAERDPASPYNPELSQMFGWASQITEQRVRPGGTFDVAKDGPYNRLDLKITANERGSHKAKAYACIVNRGVGSVFTLLMINPYAGSRPGINFTVAVPRTQQLSGLADAVSADPKIMLAAFQEAFKDHQFQFTHNPNTQTADELVEIMGEPEAFPEELVKKWFAGIPVPELQARTQEAPRQQTPPIKRKWFRTKY